jgi:hypothetical protein
VPSIEAIIGVTIATALVVVYVVSGVGGGDVADAVDIAFDNVHVAVICFAPVDAIDTVDARVS